MEILTNRKLMFFRGPSASGEKFITENAGTIHTVPDWVVKTAEFQHAVGNGYINIVETKSALPEMKQPMESVKETIVKQKDAATTKEPFADKKDETK